VFDGGTGYPYISTIDGLLRLRRLAFWNWDKNDRTSHPLRGGQRGFDRFLTARCWARRSTSLAVAPSGAGFVPPGEDLWVGSAAEGGVRTLLLFDNCIGGRETWAALVLAWALSLVFVRVFARGPAAGS
jgi:hypothetical protein